MVISFFGHRDFCESDAYEKKLPDILEELVGENAQLFSLSKRKKLQRKNL